MANSDKETVLALLREAFVAGYESPMELMEQEVERIIAKHNGNSTQAEQMNHEAFSKAMKAIAQTSLRSKKYK